MKLWLISQEANIGYDVYDSAVVVAADADAAIRIHPNGHPNGDKHDVFSSWVPPAQVTARCIGEAASDLEAGAVVCTSFNAG